MRAMRLDATALSNTPLFVLPIPAPFLLLFQVGTLRDRRWPVSSEQKGEVELFFSLYRF